MADEQNTTTDGPDVAALAEQTETDAKAAAADRLAAEKARDEAKENAANAAADRTATEKARDEAVASAKSAGESADHASPGSPIATTDTTTVPNSELRHSSAEDSADDGGATTRDDALDLGVPMTQGVASEPVGPEDALGEGAKRGDYSDRVEGRHFTSEIDPDGGQPVYAWVDKAGKEVTEGTKGATRIQVDTTPRTRLVDQTAGVADIGDVKGKKGGVETAPAAA